MGVLSEIEPPSNWPGWKKSWFKIGRGSATALQGIYNTGRGAAEHPERIPGAMRQFGEDTYNDPIGTGKSLIGYDELSKGRSRYCVGWTVQHRESAGVAEALIAQAIEQQQITRGQLTVHADHGSSMTSKPVAMLLSDLGVTKTHSRPYASTDNPYSEAHFKTLKYRPGFPARFDSIEHAREFCREFFGWYNGRHCHYGIGLMTPATVHYGLAEQTHAQRAGVLNAAYAATPERFVRHAPTPPPVPVAAWINKPDNKEAAH